MPDALAAAPPACEVDFATLSRNAPVIVLAPHPDDESLGCGALLAEAFAGPGALVICMTDGSASHTGSRRYPPDRLAAIRRKELTRAVEILGGGAQDILWLGLPDAGMPGLPEPGALIDRLCAEAARLGARCLFAPATIDPHCDHVVTAEIATALARKAGLTLFSYPIWSRWHDPDFRASLPGVSEYRFDTAAHAARKRAAIEAHESQRGLLIHDAAQAFVMEPGFIDLFATGPELFFGPHP